MTLDRLWVPAQVVTVALAGVVAAAFVSTSPATLTAMLILAAAGTIVALVVPVDVLPRLALVAFALVPIAYLPVPGPIRVISPAGFVVLLWATRMTLAGRTPDVTRVRTLALLGGWLVLSTFLAVIPSRAVTWSVAFMLLALLPAVLLARQPTAAAGVMRTWLWLSALLGAYAVVEVWLLGANPLLGPIYRAAEPVALEQTWSIYRATTTLGHPLTNGMFFAVGSVVGFHALLRRATPTLGLLTALSVAGVVCTASRGGLVALLLGSGVLALTFLLDRRGAARPGRTVLLVVLIGMFVAAFAAYAGARTASEEGAASSDVRTATLRQGLDSASENLVFGVGPGGAADHAVRTLTGDVRGRVYENAWLELLIAAGLPAVVLLGVAVAGGVRNALQNGEAGIAAALVSYSVSAAGFNLFEGHRHTLLLLGLLIGCCLAAARPPAGAGTRSMSAPTPSVPVGAPL